MTKSWTLGLVSLVLLIQGSLSQTFKEILVTTADKKYLFKDITASANLTFNSDGGGGDAEISVDDGTMYQTIFGFGATLTDASAYTLNKLKTSNSDRYAALLKAMFDVSPGAESAGMNYIRVPIGASDFSPNAYSFNDKNETTLTSFSVDVAPPYLFSTLMDIQNINSNIKIHLVAWSPPGWMKDTGTMKSGDFLGEFAETMATYLLKSVQGFKSKGFNAYAISIQNEPETENPTLPSCMYTTATEAAVAVGLRKLLDANGMNGVKIIGYEHNWDDASKYATQLMKENGAMDAYAGVAFHCYVGKMEQQDDWHNAFPDKELYFTECSGTVGSDWWNDIQYYMNNIYIGGLQHWSQVGLMWNYALDPDGNPKLSGATSCQTGCRGVVQISDAGNVQFNQEFYAMAHASKAILPVDSSGQFGRRIKVDVSIDSLLVGAYATKTASGGYRYSLVVMNSGNNAAKTSIKFKGKTATYSFPVGLTTMSWGP